MNSRAIIIDEARVITPEDIERYKPEFDKLRKMFKLSESERTLPDGTTFRLVTWAAPAEHVVVTYSGVHP